MAALLESRRVVLFDLRQALPARLELLDAAAPISNRFYRGLRDTLGLTKAEAGQLIAIHFKGTINRPPCKA